MTDHLDAIGIGVAGNFTGHLEQAGEASDFVDVRTVEAGAPKGVFPFYLPGGAAGPLGVYPLDTGAIRLGGPEDHVQLEPEVALLCELSYDDDGLVQRVTPTHFAAYDDCSIRRPGATKISEKKNWGPASKGIASAALPIDRFGPGGVLDRFRIACFLRRAGVVHEYGVDSAVRSYSYFHGRLLDWLVDRLRHQRDQGPLEDLSVLLRQSGCPQRAVVSVGATRYTSFGEQTFVERGDEAFVILYDEQLHSADALQQRLRSGELRDEGLSVLHQRVE